MRGHVHAIQGTNQFLVCSEVSKEEEVLSLCGRGTYRPSVRTHVCTCCTYSHHCICPCLILCDQIFGSNDTLEIEHSKYHVVQACSVSQLLSEDHNSQSTIQKIEDIFQIVKTWQSVPANIKKEIDSLQANVVKESGSLLWSQTTQQRFSLFSSPQSKPERPRGLCNSQTKWKGLSCNQPLLPEKESTKPKKHTYLIISDTFCDTFCICCYILAPLIFFSHVCMEYGDVFMPSFWGFFKIVSSFQLF